MKNCISRLSGIFYTLLGCVFFGLGFNLFLLPNDLNAGGISGVAMILVKLTNFGSVGLVTAILNLPLFALAYMKISKRFFWSSLIGMIFGSMSIDAFSKLPQVSMEPLLGALYGGALCGLGSGVVFISGGSTGGSDIIVRLLKVKWKNVPIGTISTCFDLAVAAMTGFVFQNMERSLYSGIAIFIAGRVIDAVVYRFDYSRVAIIISKKYRLLAEEIGIKLGRGVTFLNGEGYYSSRELKVILTAVKRQQLAELKQLVAEADPAAFVIVQEAHQVLGDGFSKYSKESL